jgi:hypothetical protein
MVKHEESYLNRTLPEIRAKKDWKPSQLPPVPDPAASIKQSEPILAIILHVLFLVFFTFSLHLFGVVRFVEGEAPTVVPFLNNEVFRGYLPLIWVLIAAGIFLESWKLIVRKWKISIIAAQMLYFAAAYAVAVYLFTNPQIWNSAFRRLWKHWPDTAFLPKTANSTIPSQTFGMGLRTPSSCCSPSARSSRLPGWHGNG